MACILDPKTTQSGEILKWDPAQIPSTKPFVHIVASASGSLITQDNMNFVKTKSLIYSPFHPSSRYVNFEIGYSKDAKWLDYLNDKWNDYANFFVGGFLEAIYSDDSTVYAQIDAKSIDFDVRFRTPTTTTSSITSSPKSPTNAFAQRRAKQSSNSLTTPKPAISTVIVQEADDSNPMADADNSKFEELQESQQNFSSVQSTPTTSVTPIAPTPTTPTRKPKRQLSDLCNDDDDDKEEGKEEKERGGRGGRGGRGRRKK